MTILKYIIDNKIAIRNFVIPLFVLLFSTIQLNAKTTRVGTVTQLQTAINNAASGDIILLLNGTYTNASISIGVSGITVKADTSGMVIFNGNSTCSITGNNITFSGFQYKNGDITNINNIIEIYGNSNTITQCNFYGYLAHNYIQVNSASQYSQITYCNFEAKPGNKNDGPAIQVTISPTVISYTKIRYCTFMNFLGLGGDFGNECIRIGEGSQQNYVSATIVEYCYFENTGLGDSESISMKSMWNVLRFNTQNTNPYASFSFRTGSNNTAYSNFFINSGGIKVKENKLQMIYNNYFQGTATGYNSSLELRSDGVVAPDSIYIYHNTFYNAGDIYLNTGSGTSVPNHLSYVNNIFYKTSGTIIADANSNASFINNEYFGGASLGVTSPTSTQFTNVDPKLTLNTNSYYGLSATSPAINNSNGTYTSIVRNPYVSIDTLLLDIEGQARPAAKAQKDMGCDEYTTGTVTNLPLSRYDVGPTYLSTTALAIYRSKSSGDYNSATSWQQYNTTTATWIDATLSPTVGASTIEILTGHVISMSQAATINDNLTIDVGGELAISPSAGNFAPNFLSLASSKIITVNGTLSNADTTTASTFSAFLLNTGASINMSATGVYNLTAAAYNGYIEIPTASWVTGSTCKISGLVGTTNASVPVSYNNLLGIGQTFSNFTIDAPNLVGNLVLTSNSVLLTNIFSVSANLTINSTGSSTQGVQLSSPGNQEVLNVNYYIQNSGTIVSLINSSTNTTAKSLILSKDFTLNGTAVYYSCLNSSPATTLSIAGSLAIAATAKFSKSGVSGSAELIFNKSGSQAATFAGLNSDNPFALTVNAGSTLTFSGNLIIDSVFSIKGVPSAVFSFKIASGASLIFSSNAVLNIAASGIVDFNSKSVTFKSSATGTAAIGTILGTLSNATNVTVERYIPSSGRRRFVLVASPVSSTINAGWQEGTGTSNTFKTAVSYGTSITGGVGQGVGTSGFDGPSTSTNSIFTYNDTKSSGTKWTALTSTTTASSLAPGTGYLLFVRGDRSENRAVTQTSSSTILRATGTIGQGTVTPALAIGVSKYTLIANPYPSTISWPAVTKNNLSTSFTVYDSNLGAFVSSNGTNKTPNSGQQQAGYIQSGQAFFVQNAASGTPSISFTESAKTTLGTSSSATTVFGNDGERPQQLNINAYRANGNVFADGAVAIFGSKYNAAVDDQEDINKFINFNETFSLRRNDQLLGLEARPLIDNSDTLFFSLSNFSKQDYNLVIDGSNFTNTIATLEDKFTATKTKLDVSAINNYRFTVTDDSTSSSNGRFIITLKTTLPKVITTNPSTDEFGLKMSPNPVNNQLQVKFKNFISVETSINFINSFGQIVKKVNAGKVSNGNLTISLTSLPSGVYMVQLVSEGNKMATQKLVKQ